MKRTTLALTLIMVLLFTVMSGTKLAQVAFAPSDGLPYKPPVVTVLSPSPNGTYNMQRCSLERYGSNICLYLWSHSIHGNAQFAEL